MSDFTVLFADPKTEDDLSWIQQLEPARSLRVIAPTEASLAIVDGDPLANM